MTCNLCLVPDLIRHVIVMGMIDFDGLFKLDSNNFRYHYIAMLCRLWNYGQKETSDVTVGIQSLVNSTARFSQVKILRMLRIRTITTLKVCIAPVHALIQIQMLKNK